MDNSNPSDTSTVTMIDITPNYSAMFDRFKIDSSGQIDMAWRESDPKLRGRLQAILAGLNIMAASIDSEAKLTEFREHLDAQAAKIAEKNNAEL